MSREEAILRIRNALRNQGYALAVHGTLTRDLDLVAIPWQETAIDCHAVAEIVADALPGHVKDEPEHKPYGRTAYTIWPDEGRHGFDQWYVDLSVMPRALTVESSQPWEPST